MTVRTENVGVVDGRTIQMVELANDQLVVKVLDLGAALWQVRPASDPDGPSMCLWHADPAQYAVPGRYIGVTVGPFANRIANSTFTLNGTVYTVEANEGAHSLHGGPTGFGQKSWTIDEDNTGEWSDANYVTFDLERPDGEGGYPGDLSVSVTWTLEGATLTFSWTAHTTAPTPVSLTNHAYWNLGGHDSIADHRLLVNAAQYVETNDELIPTGKLIDVAGTPFDLTTARRIGDVMEAVPRGLLDDCYVFDGTGSARLSDPDSQRSIDLVTSMPGIQIYTAGDGVCLETQHLPDAPNHDNFPSSILEPGHLTTHQTQLVFGFDAAM